MDTRILRTGGFAAGAVACFCGVARFAADLVEVGRTRSWPSVSGVIDHAAIKHSCGGRGGVSYAPDIEYSYVVGGRTFHGKRTAVWDRTCLSRDRAQEFTAREYKVGKPVTVYNKPEDPSAAVLEPGETWRGTWLFIVLLTGIAGAFAYGSYASLHAVRVRFRFVVKVNRRPP